MCARARFVTKLLASNEMMMIRISPRRLSKCTISTHTRDKVPRVCVCVCYHCSGSLSYWSQWSAQFCCLSVCLSVSPRCTRTHTQVSCVYEFAHTHLPSNERAHTQIRSFLYISLSTLRYGKIAIAIAIKRSMSVQLTPQVLIDRLGGKSTIYDRWAN